MERMRVKNFLVLKDIDIEINKINILIGPQAEGKSIIAKLVYLFKYFMMEYRDSIFANTTQANFNKKIIGIFTDIFTPYTWQSTEFEIRYFYNDLEISLIANKKLNRKKSSLTLSYSNEIETVFRHLKKEYAKAIKVSAIDKSPPDIDRYQTDIGKRVGKLFHKDGNSEMEFTTFIPAGRSFFSNIESRVWTFFAKDYSLDYFIRAFGMTYEGLKSSYSKFPKTKDSRFHQAKSLLKDIFKGDYYFSTKWEIVVASNTILSPAKCSSGQQELLPMAVVLTVYGMVEEKNYFHFFLIEEPEAHLFPTSQKRIVDFFSLLYNLNKTRIGFFITTHSPYILTSFNNLIQAKASIDSVESLPDSDVLRNKIYSVVQENTMISFKDVSAYFLSSGVLTDLKDSDTQLLNANMMDDISDELNNTLGKLLDIQES